MLAAAVRPEVAFTDGIHARRVRLPHTAAKEKQIKPAGAE
jgi:hypothetical protein